VLTLWTTRVMVKSCGVGYHANQLDALDPEVLVLWAKVLFAFEIVYFVSMTLPKMAILFLYLRVFGWQGRMRIMTQVLLGLVVASGVANVVTTCFMCQPLTYWWDGSVEGGHCIDVQAFFHAQCVPGFALDLPIMVLPLQTIWRLKLPAAKRVALLFVFLVASL